MTELSDSNIFLTYKVNKFFDPEFFDLHPYPPTFIWLDKNGKKMKEHVIRMDRKHDIYISEIEAGKGDYFLFMVKFLPELIRLTTYMDSSPNMPTTVIRSGHILTDIRHIIRKIISIISMTSSKRTMAT
ncbi:MAG: hypothetical protein IPL69_02150 [Saprospiraceae bacterium]|nr:hypothetical protein [Candidatus Brachybacter algidus]